MAGDLAKMEIRNSRDFLEDREFRAQKLLIE